MMMEFQTLRAAQSYQKAYAPKMGLYFDGIQWVLGECDRPVIDHPLEENGVRYSHSLLPDFSAQQFVYEREHIPTGKKSQVIVYVEFPGGPEKVARLIDYWNCTKIWKYKLLGGE